MEYIPTAREFAEDVAKRANLILSEQELQILTFHFQGFAESHVHNALESAVVKIRADAMEDYGTDIPDCWNEESILNAYPDELIK